MAIFDGQLKDNEIFGSLFNMVISQQVFADNIAGLSSALVDKARVDGGLYGDTKLYYASDALKSADWGNDAEAENLLALHRPPEPECQAIRLDKFRQICVTVDSYMTKRAWKDEGAFASFNAVVTAWLGDTKKIYDTTLYNTYIGTVETNVGKQQVTVDVDANGRTTGENIAEAIANLLDDVSDVSRDYNDYGNIRAFRKEDIEIVWNSKYLNEVKKVDLPSIFHSEQLMDTFKGDSLNKKYFGTVKTTAGNAPNPNTTIRSLIEKDYGSVHVFPGELIPNGAAYTKDTVYEEKSDIICKVMVKLPPYMSAFEVGTSFFNPKSLTETKYLTFGHNTLEYLQNYPLITVKAI